jgi:ubiquinone/menaquinone biosynthesis C-methylase UbiE
MKRQPVTHEIVFSSEDYASKYADQHRGMAEKFGEDYAQKLRTQGFSQGKIIDVGCGFGATNIALAKHFPDSKLVGIDLSEPLLDYARKAAAEADLSYRMQFEKADVHGIPYPENSFDVAININMLHLVEEPIKMLDEIERVLKPDGKLYIADLRRSLLGFLEDEIRSALTITEANELFNQSMIRAGNFKWGLLWWKFESR